MDKAKVYKQVDVIEKTEDGNEICTARYELIDQKKYENHDMSNEVDEYGCTKFNCYLIREIESLTDYIDLILSINKSTIVDQNISHSEGFFERQFFYRGQSDSKYFPLSTIFREDINALKEHDKTAKKSIMNYTYLEKRYIIEAKRQFPEEFSSDLSQFELLTKLKHFDMPVRVLDVSINPIVALYFACNNSSPETDGFIYSYLQPALNSSNDMWEIDQRTHKEIFQYRKYAKVTESNLIDELCKCPLVDKATKTPPEAVFAFPSYNNSRIRAQSGALIICNSSNHNILTHKEIKLGGGFIYAMSKADEKTADFKTLNGKDLNNVHLPLRIKIPYRLKANILYDLSLLGYNDYAFFPEPVELTKTIRKHIKNKLNKGRVVEAGKVVMVGGSKMEINQN